MCGVVGIFAYRAPGGETLREEAVAVREAMRARGPDGEGLWFSHDQRTCLAHRRLSILDLSPAGAQPMLTGEDDTPIVITFNGEIYNYVALRNELAADGARFRSTGDTEVLLRLYQRHGVSMLQRLRGMYAFVIWDGARRRLVAARDPFGIKPLYFADDGRVVRFASQAKALLATGAIDTAPDPAGSVGFHVFGHVPDPFTLYRGIRSLPAGAVLTVDDGGPVVERPLIDIVDRLVAAEGSRPPRPTSNETVIEALQDSVVAHLVADVDVGAFLSAGKDSSAIVALAARSHQRLHTLTLGFREYAAAADDEVPVAEDVAMHCGTRHRTAWITKTDFEGECEHLLRAMDQPTIDGVNVYFVARAAAQGGMKVALSGLGGDELFAGYSNFERIPRIVKWFGRLAGWPELGRLLRRLAAPAMARFGNRKYASLVEYGSTPAHAYLLCRAFHLPWELPSLLDPEVVREGLERLAIVDRLRAVERRLTSMRAKVAALEMCFYMRNQLLRDADWAGMAHSVEIRVPFVDTVLLDRLAARVVGSAPWSKAAFLDGLADTLPAAVRLRPKTGFTTPVARWLDERAASSNLSGWGRHVYQRVAGDALSSR